MCVCVRVYNCIGLHGTLQRCHPTQSTSLTPSAAPAAWQGCWNSLSIMHSTAYSISIATRIAVISAIAITFVLPNLLLLLLLLLPLLCHKDLRPDLWLVGFPFHWKAENIVAVSLQSKNETVIRFVCLLHNYCNYSLITVLTMYLY